MPDTVLYTQVVPSDAQTRAQDSATRNLATSGTVGQGGAHVQPVSQDPSTHTLHGQYRGKYAGRMAGELRELFTASDIDTVPYFGLSGRTSLDGYYALDTGTTGPVDPRSDDYHEFSGTLKFIGTTRSHWRSVASKVTDVDHPFSAGSTNTTALVGVPAAASRVRWYDAATSSTSPATPTATRTGEFGDVDVYDSNSSDNPYTEARLIYSLDYGEVGKMDCRVWDDHSVAKTDTDGITAWQKAYRTDHEYHGLPVIENGLIRLQPDEASQTLTAWEWDTGSSTWTSLALGASNWELAEWDTRAISPVRIEAITEWQDPTQSPTATYALRGILHRGSMGVQYDRTGLEDSGVPVGLQDHLAPIASTSIKDAGGRLGLVSRSEVRP